MPIDDPIEKYTDKYTGHLVTHADLRTATDGLPAELAAVLCAAVFSLQSCEQQLLHVASSLQETAAKIRANVDAVPDQPVLHLNSMGELLSNGARTDMLIALRADRIEQLRRLVWLWQHRTASIEPADVAAGEPANLIRPSPDLRKGAVPCPISTMSSTTTTKPSSSRSSVCC